MTWLKTVVWNPSCNTTARPASNTSRPHQMWSKYPVDPSGTASVWEGGIPRYALLMCRMTAQRSNICQAQSQLSSFGFSSFHFKKPWPQVQEHHRVSMWSFGGFVDCMDDGSFEKSWNFITTGEIPKEWRKTLHDITMTQKRFYYLKPWSKNPSKHNVNVCKSWCPTSNCFHSKVSPNPRKYTLIIYDHFTSVIQQDPSHLRWFDDAVASNLSAKPKSV